MYVISYYDNYGQGTIHCESYEDMQDTMSNLNLCDDVSGVYCNYEDDETGEIF